MKFTLAALLAAAVPLCAATLDTTVTADTYIRNDGTPNSVNNEDIDNELLVGSNGALDNLRGLLGFDVTPIVNDVNTIGGGNFSSLVINSASLQLFERRGRANTVNVVVNRYGFSFDPATSTWNAPGVGDVTPGGTIGTPLGSQSITWEGTADSEDATVTLSGSGIAAAISAHVGNSVNFLLTTNTPFTQFLSFSSDRAASSARDARLLIDYTVIPVGVNGNFLANGDFEAATGAGVFPVGWTLTGTPSQAAPFLVSGGGTNAVSLAPSQGILQDFASPPAAAMEDFQADFAFQIGNETQAHRVRLEGNNGADLVSLRLTTNPAGDDSIDVFGGTFAAALTGLTIIPNTTYFIRVIGRNFGLAGRGYTVGFSTDGVSYTTSGNQTAFHNFNAKFETVTFECGGTAGSSLLIDNVAVTLPPDDDFAAWISGFTFAPGADITAEGDADNDGISNVMENVFGTPPNAASAGVTGISGSTGSVGFQHPLNPDLASDVSYSYEWSTDLAEWRASGVANTGTTVVTITPEAPVVGVVTVNTAVTTGTAGRLFTRIVATAAP